MCCSEFLISLKGKSCTLKWVKEERGNCLQDLIMKTNLDKFEPNRWLENQSSYYVRFINDRSRVIRSWYNISNRVTNGVGLVPTRHNQCTGGWENGAKPIFPKKIPERALPYKPKTVTPNCNSRALICLHSSSYSLLLTVTEILQHNLSCHCPPLSLSLQV